MMNQNILMPIMIFMTRSYHSSQILRRPVSVFLQKLKFILPALAGAMLLILSSCEEKPTIIGSDLLPFSDSIAFKSTDTITVSAFTQFKKNVITNNQTFSYLGKINDLYFGETTLDFVAQLRLTAPWAKTGPFTVDSVVLVLTIQGAKGVLDTNYHQKLKMYEIDDQLSSTQAYYSNTIPTIKSEIGTFELPIIRKDTIQTMVISLPPSFGVHLMDTTKLTQDDDANDFRKYFKGIYFTLEDSPSPLLLGMAFTTTSSGEIYFPFIEVYYHTNSSGVAAINSFAINANSVRYNKYTHIYNSTTPAYKHITDGLKDSLVYLQAFNGAYPVIKLPGLENFKKNITGISVNKARLTFSIFLDSINYKVATIPSQILMKYVVTDTTQYVLPDYSVSTSFFDGTANSTTLTYTFNIASFVQMYLEGAISKPEVEMYFPTGEYKNVILKANNSHTPAKFDFVYSRY
jgi:hypothetical protein